MPPICGRYAACAVYAVAVAICCAIRCFPLHFPLLSRCFVAIINSCYPVAPRCCTAHAAGHPSGGVSHVVRTFDPQNAPGARTPSPRMRPTGGEASSAEGTYPQPPPPRCEGNGAASHTPHELGVGSKSDGSPPYPPREIPKWAGESTVAHQRRPLAATHPNPPRFRSGYIQPRPCGGQGGV